MAGKKRFPLREGGFTLIELLTVIGIMGILFGIGIPAIQGYQRRQTLDVSTRQVAADLQWAQSRAMNTGSVYKVTFLQNTNKYEIENEGTNAKVEKILPSKITLSSSLDFVRFRPQGTVEVDTIILSISGEWKKVTLNQLGETNISY